MIQAYGANVYKSMGDLFMNFDLSIASIILTPIPKKTAELKHLQSQQQTQDREEDAKRLARTVCQELHSPNLTVKNKLEVSDWSSSASYR